MKRIINGIVLFIMIIGGVALFTNSVDALNLFGHTPKHIKSGKAMELSYDDVLISYSFSNYAWSQVDYGELVFNDGKRYLYNCTFKGDKECVYKAKGTIKSKDLNNIKKYGKTLDNKSIKMENTANDAGENSIKYYKNGDAIYLKGRGDNKIDNNSTESKKILKILKKYRIYI